MIPEQYKWLDREVAPKMLMEAITLLGTKEVIGSLNNPVIMDWAQALKIKEYNMDSIPWCGLFIAYLALITNKTLPTSPLWALSWSKWGEGCEPELGCVLTFKRNGGGHVGLYVGEDLECYHVLGGNQGDSVSITRIKKSRLDAARCHYKNKPTTIRKIHLSPVGSVSTNEA